MRSFELGPDSLHLRLPLGQWAADGLLAIFFFVAGLELKREFVIGDLKDPAKAALPVAAALCGVAVPAILFVAVATGLTGGADAGGDLLSGWAIPTATDTLDVRSLLLALIPLSLFGFLVQRRITYWWLLIPIALSAWALVHARRTPPPPGVGRVCRAHLRLLCRRCELRGQGTGRGRSPRPSAIPRRSASWSPWSAPYATNTSSSPSSSAR